ncbi:MAG: hypothetical protein OEV55_00755 [candidate division Zixibacteria bacterium]|nr:hypothetical protein [candidate division Zixibacteria bacterium]
MNNIVVLTIIFGVITFCAMIIGIYAYSESRKTNNLLGEAKRKSSLQRAVRELRKEKELLTKEIERQRDAKLFIKLLEVEEEIYKKGKEKEKILEQLPFGRILQNEKLFVTEATSRMEQKKRHWDIMQNFILSLGGVAAVITIILFIYSLIKQ